MLPWKIGISQGSIFRRHPKTPEDRFILPWEMYHSGGRICPAGYICPENLTILGADCYICPGNLIILGADSFCPGKCIILGAESDLPQLPGAAGAGLCARAHVLFQHKKAMGSAHLGKTQRGAPKGVQIGKPI